MYFCAFLQFIHNPISHMFNNFNYLTREAKKETIHIIAKPLYYKLKAAFDS